jgi:hypothetical protein
MRPPLLVIKNIDESGAYSAGRTHHLVLADSGSTTLKVRGGVTAIGPRIAEAAMAASTFKTLL